MVETRAGWGGKGLAGARVSGGLKHILLVVATAASAAVLLVSGIAVAPAAAFGTPIACGSPSQSAVFAPWGDANAYFRVSNGGFENGATDWALSGGAAVVAGNEWYAVGGASDSHSLKIPYNGAAESRTLCVSRNQNVVRLFVNNQHVSGAILHVEAWAQNPATGAWAVTAFDVNGDVSSSWNPTPQLQIPNMFGGSGNEYLYLRFTTRGSVATWNVDDVYIDPFKNW